MALRAHVSTHTQEKGAVQKCQFERDTTTPSPAHTPTPTPLFPGPEVKQDRRGLHGPPQDRRPRLLAKTLHSGRGGGDSWSQSSRTGREGHWALVIHPFPPPHPLSFHTGCRPGTWDQPRDWTKASWWSPRHLCRERGGLKHLPQVLTDPTLSGSQAGRGDALAARGQTRSTQSGVYSAILKSF